MESSGDGKGDRHDLATRPGIQEPAGAAARLVSKPRCIRQQPLRLVRAKAAHPLFICLDEAGGPTTSFHRLDGPEDQPVIQGARLDHEPGDIGFHAVILSQRFMFE